MRSLYWKIFLSFWLATILIIFSTAWITSEIAQKASIPAREQVFMDSHAEAAVATFESGKHQALIQWLEKIGRSKKMSLYLLCNNGEIIGNHPPSDLIKHISHDLVHDQLDDGLLKFGNLIVSHEVFSTKNHAYRLIALSDKPLSHFVKIQWAGLSLRLIIAAFISGLICYLLSIYLTKPLRSLQMAAKLIGKGKLNTRVGRFKGHHRDEIAELSDEFDSMAEELERLVASKERLLQDISHELRSPLARLQIAIELGRKQSFHSEAAFSRMELECLRLNRLIGEVLDFARLDKKSTELHKDWINLNALLETIIKDASFEFEKMSPKISFIAAKDISFLGDERLLHRAIENILRNALHHSDNNKQVSVELNNCSSYLTISISDQGPGIGLEHLDKIFNPFYRVDSAREQKTGGYGLGLSIAKQAIEINGGTIEARNKATGGLLVEISLPNN